MAKDRTFEKNICRPCTACYQARTGEKMRTTYPKVVIVGRTNVGKSTLFNRLTKQKKSIVFPREGVTRDYIHEIVTWNKRTFDLIDTGGLILAKHTDPITKEVEQSVHAAIKDATIILFVCDGKNGLVEHDRQLTKILHKSKKPVFLLLNKADNTNAFKEHEYEFQALGFKNTFPISALHGTGIREVLDAVTTHEALADAGQIKPEKETVAYNVTILGKPNVGKSSLLNLLLKEQRAIISEVAGTTREALSELISFHKELVKLTDTPGVRRKSKVEDPLELEMVKSSLGAVRKSDIIIVMIDSNDGHIADQELKLLFYAYEQKKSIILLLNKTDILTNEKKEQLKYDMLRYEFFLKKIPTAWISCKTQKNIGTVFKMILKARERRLQTFEEAKVDEIVKEAIRRRPMYHKTQLLKVLRVKPIKTIHEIPTFILYVNFPQWFGPTQLGYIENQIRRHFDLLGCPIQLIPRAM
jgi:GTP-binding protein